MQLDQLIAGLGITPRIGGGGRGAAPASLHTRICDLTEDSRTVMPHSLFVARRGTKSDGRAFVDAAAKAGAVAILTDDPNLHVSGPVILFTPDVPTTAACLAERFYGYPTDHLALIGITGTKGKTTTAWLVHQLLNRAAIRCGLIGTVCIDDGAEVAPASLTTPPALELSRTFAKMVECGCRAAAIEASSHALDQGRTAGLRFRIGVFTNLAHDHLDYHQTMDHYAAAKAKLFAALPSSGGIAIVNAADPWAARMVRDCPADVIGCLIEGEGSPTATPQNKPSVPVSARATINRLDAGGMDVTFTGAWGGGNDKPASLRLPLIGAHNAMNALQAAVVAHRAGLHHDEITSGLACVSSPPGRLEPVTPPDAPFAVYVDYAHTEESLRQVLAVARRLCRGHLHAVIGCGGDRDRTKRPRMGEAAASLADHLWITSDNPRTEDPQRIIDAIVAGVPASARGRVRVQIDRARAIHGSIAAAAPGDIVVIAGKGHETYQIMPDGQGGGGTVTRHFDDREEARAALAQRGLRPTITSPAHILTTSTPHSHAAGRSRR